jgi:hypothetical protein
MCTFSSVAAARLLVMAGLLTCCGVLSAATVVLRDGTLIHGEIKSLQDGVYTIETQSVGTVHVRKQAVRSIEEGGVSAIEPGVGSGALDAAKSRIAQDPDLLAAVLALQNDPDVLAVLADPQIMKAIAAGDYTALMNNPKIVALMNNAKVRKIIGETR